MKQKIFLFSSALIIGAFVINLSLKNSESGLYQPRINNPVQQTADGMMEYYHSVRKNVLTGEIEPNDYALASLAIDQMFGNANRSVSITFTEEGPDNVGGRTRAILVDRNDKNIVYAGSVSGGLFKSTNGGNTWTRLDNFSGNLSISTMVQTPSGTIYIGTGASFEVNAFSAMSNGNNTGGHPPDGVWYTDDAGNSFTKLSTSFGSANINRIVVDPNANDKIWVCGSLPVRLSSIENKGVPVAQPNINGNVQDVKISKDGNIMICNVGTQTWVSTNAGGSFSRVSGFGPGQIKQTATSGITRIKYAISHEKNSNGMYNIYAVQVRNEGIGALGGVSISQDNGQTWVEIIPETPNTLTAEDALPTDPFSNGANWQGNYDCAISVIPGNPNSFILGGVRLFRWDMSTTSPPYGNFYLLATSSSLNIDPRYVHADIHEFLWNTDNKLYIGNDGGITVSDDAAITKSPSFYESNRGYSTTQFYGIGYGKDGSLIGGTQDNGTPYKDALNISGSTSFEFADFLGGDGFDCDISYLDESVLIGTSQNGNIERSADNGSSMSPLVSSEMIGLPAQFFTTVRLFENDNDTNSTDSITFIAKESKNIGDTIMVPSKNMSLLFPHILTQNLTVLYDTIFITNDTIINGVNYNVGDTALSINFQDTIRVQDVIQTITATGLTSTGGVWVTRGALRFGTTPVWWKVLNSVSTTRVLEFSKDGNILYVGETNGKVTRIKGFNNVYYNNEAFDTINGIDDHDSVSFLYADVRSGSQQLEIQTILNGGAQSVTGIAVDPNDPEHVVVTLGGYSAATNILRSTTAASTTGASSFTSIKGNLPSLPVYDAIIDYQNSNVILVGTEMGIYGTDNSGTTWDMQAGELGRVPVFALRQQWRPWNKVYGNQGVIYAGTHGRGIWSSNGLAGIDETAVEQEDPLKKVHVYPNPANDFTKIQFDLEKSGRVDLEIYNIQGKLVETKVLNNVQSGQVKTTLDLGNYKRGTYFVNLRSGKGKYKVAKFIKR